MAERSGARFEEATKGGVAPGEYIAVNIDGLARCVGLYVTIDGQAIWYDSDENYDYECASSAIDISGIRGNCYE